MELRFQKRTGRDDARRPGDNAATAMKSVVLDVSTYDWEGDAPLQRPSSQTIVYELHVRGFTRHPSSGVCEKTRGTFAGLIEKIPYLQRLGITAVELLPVFQFDAQDSPPGRVNYWGYAPVSFFAPHQAYSSRRDPLGPVDEFRDMVKALHRAGIEVILDVVFNHTAEGDHTRPDAELSRTGQRDLLHPRGGSRALRQLQRHGKHPERQPSDRPPHDRGQSPLLGGEHARRRVPVRPCVDSGARSVGPVDPESARAVGHRIGSGASGHEAHRRGVGRRRVVSGRQLRR